MSRFEGKVVVVTGGARVVMDGGTTVQLFPACCEDDTSKMRER